MAMNRLFLRVVFCDSFVIVCFLFLICTAILFITPFTTSFRKKKKLDRTHSHILFHFFSIHSNVFSAINPSYLKHFVCLVCLFELLAITQHPINLINHIISLRSTHHFPDTQKHHAFHSNLSLVHYYFPNTTPPPSHPPL